MNVDFLFLGELLLLDSVTSSIEKNFSGLTEKSSFHLEGNTFICSFFFHSTTHLFSHFSFKIGCEL